jgi:hypothetical protein
MIISVWNAPRWAHAARSGADARGRGRRSVDPAKWDAMAHAIVGYLLRLKRMNGAEPAMFSFNEANLGINVLLSAEEQRDAMKRLGAAFASAGLKTRMLLGDANAPIHVTYVDAALADPEAMRYVSGISFHSWNQFTDEHLAGWRARAVSAGVPLFVGEGGTDPDSYHYPDVCLEPWFALDEAVMYLRCLSVAQPLSMLHWELTANYGLGRPTRDGTFEPAMRWWQYKQISQLTPPNSAVIAARSDDRQLTVAALSGRGQSVGALHIANTGAQRTVMIRGFAPDARTMKCHITDAARGMEELPAVNIVGGEATMVIPTQCLLTLSAPTP